MTAPPVRDWSTPREAGTLFLRGRTVRTALPIAAVVGTLLSAVNQGVIITGGDADTMTWIRVAVELRRAVLCGELRLSGRPSPTGARPGRGCDRAGGPDG